MKLREGRRLRLGLAGLVVCFLSLGCIIDQEQLAWFLPRYTIDPDQSLAQVVTPEVSGKLTAVKLSIVCDSARM